MRLRLADAATARRQAVWIAAIEPWRGLGYGAAGLGRWLARGGRAGRVIVAEEGGLVVGIVVVSPEVLLGDFVALVAVRPEAAGRGIGRRLVDRVARRTFAQRRWLYTSSDAGNVAAGRFWRALGFVRVGRLPDLVRPGRTEILWRLGRPASAARPGRRQAGGA
jgi:ribosomal protein S18 acetylase RimI-like enzyme